MRHQYLCTLGIKGSTTHMTIWLAALLNADVFCKYLQQPKSACEEEGNALNVLPLKSCCGLSHLTSTILMQDHRQP